ncbi:MAG: gluconate 2-dehydrogenase subunit 3 family protein [Thermoleophilaceae bacterium]
MTPQMHGRYPDYDVMDDAGHWDPVTREVIERRERERPKIRFFTGTEARCLGRFLDAVLAQDAEPRIPVLGIVDAKLHAGRLDGYRFADMPQDTETWRVVAAGLDHSARGRGAPDLAGAGDELVRELIEDLSRGRLDGGPWERVNVSRAWSVVMRGALAAFYSHPWAWNEIGFGGPAYPRGYLRRRMGPAGRDPDEAPEAFAVDPVSDIAARGGE